jgi:hypothetical protein
VPSHLLSRDTTASSSASLWDMYKGLYEHLLIGGEGRGGVLLTCRRVHHDHFAIVTKRKREHPAFWERDYTNEPQH